MDERVRKVLQALAKRRWAERGPGVLLAKVQYGVILDHWIPLDRITNQVPAFAQDLLTPEDWARLRDDGLAPEVLGAASPTCVPVVYCGEISTVPGPRESSFFWVV